MLLKLGTISRAVSVGKFVGHGFLNLATARGDVKMYHGDHQVSIPYTREARPGEPGYVASPTEKIPQGLVKKAFSFVVPEDAAKALGIFLKESVEEEQARWAVEAEAKKVADAEAAAKAAADAVV